ncbi:MAG: pentapeptide repeat-containing protein [Rubrivivax sp.]|nr:pentapeptide repeat-containing protein [Rubrivivax sp.]
MSTIKLADCEHTLDARDANLGDSRFNDVRLANCRFQQVTLEGSVFDDVSFAGVAVRNGVYTGMTIEGIDVDALLCKWRSGQTAAAVAA